MALSPQANQVVEDPSAKAQMTQLEESIRWLESALSAEENVSSRKEMETRLAESRQRLQFVEKNRYMVDTVSLEAYGANM